VRSGGVEEGGGGGGGRRGGGRRGAGLLQRLGRLGPARSRSWSARRSRSAGGAGNRPCSVAPWSGGTTGPCADGGAGGSDRPAPPARQGGGGGRGGGRGGRRVGSRAAGRARGGGERR